VRGVAQFVLSTRVRVLIAEMRTFLELDTGRERPCHVWSAFYRRLQDNVSFANQPSPSEFC